MTTAADLMEAAVVVMSGRNVVVARNCFLPHWVRGLPSSVSRSLSTFPQGKAFGGGMAIVQRRPWRESLDFWLSFGYNFIRKGFGKPEFDKGGLV